MSLVLSLLFGTTQSSTQIRGSFISDEDGVSEETKARSSKHEYHAGEEEGEKIQILRLN